MIVHTLLVVTLKVIICINNTWNRPCIEQVSFNHLWRSLEMLDDGRKSFIIEELLHEIPWQFSSSLCEKTPHGRKLKSCSIYWLLLLLLLRTPSPTILYRIVALISMKFFSSFILSSTYDRVKVDPSPINCLQGQGQTKPQAIDFGGLKQHVSILSEKKINFIWLYISYAARSFRVCSKRPEEPC